VVPLKVTLQLVPTSKPVSVKVTLTSAAIARLMQNGTTKPMNRIVKMKNVTIFVFIILPRFSSNFVY